MPANLFALAAGGIASAVTGDLIPLVAASAASLLYLSLLTVMPSFRRAVRANFHAQEMSDIASPEEQEALLRELAPSQREHFAALSELKKRILARYEQLRSGRVLAASTERKLEALLTSFLRLVTTLNNYKRFLSAGDRGPLEAELKQLENEVKAPSSEALLQVKQRRIDILKKRVERFVHAEESREVISHQLASIEDIMRLTHEQAIAMKDVPVVSTQLDALVAEVEAAALTSPELENIMKLDAIDPLAAADAELAAQQGDRVR